jgi:tRNA U38,U39,U40 pseudouridine synthase TruA
MYCKNKSKITRELRHKLESELEKNIRVRDNQSEENDNLNACFLILYRKYNYW